MEMVPEMGPWPHARERDQRGTDATKEYAAGRHKDDRLRGWLARQQQTWRTTDAADTIGRGRLAQQQQTRRTHRLRVDSLLGR